MKNERMKSDYERLRLLEDKNTYYDVTRDKGSFVINESSYPLRKIVLSSPAPRKLKRKTAAAKWKCTVKDGLKIAMNIYSNKHARANAKSYGRYELRRAMQTLRTHF